MTLEDRLGKETFDSLDTSARSSIQRLVDSLIWVPVPQPEKLLGPTNIIAASADLCFIPDMEEIMRETPALVRAIFDPSEIIYSMIQVRPGASLAARYAAKEAAFKACGYSLREMIVVHQVNKNPSVRLEVDARERALRLGITNHILGLSHDGDYALAFFIALGTTSDKVNFS